MWIRRVMRVLLAGAMLMACNTDRTEAIDTTASQLARSPDVDERDYASDYIDELTGRIMDVTWEFIPRLDAHEIDLVLAGELTSQEALELNDEEYAALLRRMDGLAAESQAVMAEADRWFAEKKNDGKGPKDKEECDDNYELCLATVFAGGVRAGAWGVVVVLVGGAYCLCQHCKGGTVDKVCGAMRL
jgi:hypothetical protein